MSDASDEEVERAQIIAAAQALRDGLRERDFGLGPILFSSATYGAWSIVLTKDAFGYFLSMRLLDPTRSSRHDWWVLGALAEAIGAPPGTPDSILHAPGGSHEWKWPAS